MVFFLFMAFKLAFAGSDPLPSWNQGTAKAVIVDFVKSVTTKGDPSYVDPADRIVVFDNDGTLMSEQPIYFQFLFEAVKLKEISAMNFSMTDSGAEKPVAIGYCIGKRPIAAFGNSDGDFQMLQNKDGS